MPNPPPAVHDVIAAVHERFGPVATSSFRDQTRIVVSESQAFDVLEFLKHLTFDLLVDISCVDYLDYPDAQHRFGLVYLLASTTTNERLTVRVFVDDPDPSVRSVVGIWSGANWLEREVWDLFGVRFEGHPDLRRLVMPEEFTAHPLRKDYPLQGHGERHNFPVISRDHS
ncbi:MAG: NADH-quinone oxidoreductase subunit C [Pirellulales bacterium]